MVIKANVQIGGVSYQFEVEEKDELESLNKIITLTNPPRYCEACKNDEPDQFKFTTNKDKEANVYVNVKCRKCGAKCKLGQYKSGGYFWRHPFERYERQSTSGGQD